MNTKMVNNTLHNRVLLYLAVDTIKGDVNLTCKNVYLDLSFIKFTFKKKKRRENIISWFFHKLLQIKIKTCASMPFKIKLSFLIFCKKRIEKQLQKNKIKRHSIKQKWEQACKLEQNEHMKINHNNQVHCQQTRIDSCSRTGLLARSPSLHLLTSVYTSQQPTQEIAEKSFVYNILKYISHHTVYREMQIVSSIHVQT